MTSLRPKWIVPALGLALVLCAVVWLRGRAAPAGPAAPTTTSAAAKRPRAPRPREERRVGLEGQVVEPSKAPVGHATVCASASSSALSEAETAEPTCVETGSDGRYRIAGLVPARYRLAASAAHHLPAAYVSPEHRRFVDLEPGRTAAGLDITLEPGGVEVRGHVKDIAGGFVRGAQVVARPGGFRRWDDGFALARSGAEGRFSVWLPEGPVVVSAVADGYAEGSADGAAPGPELEILLTPESVLAGRVVEAGGGAPLPGAKIALDVGWGPGDTTAAIADEEGRFRVRRLAPGRYKPAATAPGRYGQAKESVLLGLGQTSDEVVIEVHPAADVVARVVVTPGDGPCVEGGAELADAARKETRTAALEKGAARFEGVLPGSYDVTVTCKDHVPEPKYPPVVVATADVTGLTWNVHEGLALRGHVVDRDDKPVRASVRAVTKGGGPRAQRTNGYDTAEADGSFAMKGLVPATYTVTATVGDHPAPDPVVVELRAGGAPDLKIVVDGGGDVEGKVSGEDGRPVAGADMTAQGPKFRFGDQVKTQTDGSFVLKGLAPGDYRVIARSEGATLRAPGKGDDDPAGVPVTVKAGTTARVSLVVERRDGEIHGKVVDDAGEAVTDAFVEAERETDRTGAAAGAARRSVRWGSFTRSPSLTDMEGKFSITGLGKGAYTLRAYRKGGGETFADHAELGQSVTLTFRVSGSIAGTVTAAKGDPPDQVTLRVVDAAAGLRRTEVFFRTGGAWAMRDLPAGSYEVSAEAPEGTALVSVSLADAEQKEGVTLTLAGRTTVTGQVVSLDDGTPIPGIRVTVNARKGAGWFAPEDPDRNNITDDSGRFRVDRAPVGPITLALGPLDARTSPYSLSLVPAETVDGPVSDVGRLTLARTRLASMERGADLGFSLADRPPGVTPGDVVYTVALVRPGGPAAEAGLQAGDVIVSVDGHDVTGSMGYLYAALMRVPEGTTVALGVKRGAVVQVTAVKPP